MGAEQLALPEADRIPITSVELEDFRVSADGNTVTETVTTDADGNLVTETVTTDVAEDRAKAENFQNQADQHKEQSKALRKEAKKLRKEADEGRSSERTRKILKKADAKADQEHRKYKKFLKKAKKFRRAVKKAEANASKLLAGIPDAVQAGQVATPGNRRRLQTMERLL